MGLRPGPPPEHCPLCGADASHLCAHQYPAASLPIWNPEVLAHYDGILYWSCTHCGQAWHHWDLTSPVHHIAAKHMTGDNDA